jgi:hypothetical protein
MLFQLPREFLTHRLLGDLPFVNRKIGSRDIARLVTLSRATQTPSPECRRVNSQRLRVGDFPLGENAIREVDLLCLQTPSAEMLILRDRATCLPLTPWGPT